MAKPELGTKRVCVSCSTKFYDLTRTPAVCPKCGAEQPAEQPRLRRGGGNVIDERRRAKVIPVPGPEEPDAEVEVAAEAETETEEEDEAAEAADELDTDDEVVEVETESGDES